ncbi:hypothetical protein AALO_G00037860 [Alosa alosa]|uniref:Uncharacterized protein n=1 Tax=Alosa alosa TaxID=278164 RepID=A0AAV6H7E7_9TELE|nr:hypothetical protein AALO_G00037860 [Alosa alosa]
MIKPVAPSLKEKTKEFLLAINEVTGFMVEDTVKLKTPQTISKNCEYSNVQQYGRCYQYNHQYNITIGGVGVVSGEALIDLHLHHFTL